MYCFSDIWGSEQADLVDALHFGLRNLKPIEHCYTKLVQKFDNKIKDAKYYSNQIKELKDTMDGCDDKEILAKLKITLNLLKKRWKKTNCDILEMSQDKDNSTPTSSDGN